MSLLVAIVAYLLNSISLTIDKFLLSKSIQNPLTYVFYVNAVSLLSLVLLPLTKVPSLPLFLLVSLSTMVWSIAAYCMFKSIQVGNITRVIPVIGSLTSLFLLIHGIYAENISLNQAAAAIILIFGLILITFTDWKGQIKKEEVLIEVLSAIFFALFYLISKESYLRLDFLTVLIWSRIILLPLTLLIIFVPSLKKMFLTYRGKSVKLLSVSGLFFIGGQIVGGASGVLVNYAIALSSNPTLVASLQGVQYVFLFLFTLFLFKTFPKVFHIETTFFNLSTKFLGIILIFSGLFILAFS